MPDYTAFWGSRGKAASLWDDPNRAAGIVQMIQDHPTSVTIDRAGTVLAAQTVLAVEARSGARLVQGPAGNPAELTLVLIGVQNHDTLDDFDVQKGDRFRLWNTNWRVIAVRKYHNWVVEAHCEGQQ